MTVLRYKSGTDIIRQEFGIRDGTSDDLGNGLKQSYVSKAMEHMVTFLQEKATNDNIQGLTISARFPQFPKGQNEDYVAEMQIPFVSVSLSLGAMKEVGIGRAIMKTVDGTAYGFRQIARFEFDIASQSDDETDRIVGWINEKLQIHKAELYAKGFQNAMVIYSRPAHGWNSSMAWDFTEIYYMTRLFRHLMYLEVSFDVVWILQDESSGRIMQICFGESSVGIASLNMGISLEYLLAEEMRYNMHSIRLGKYL